MKMLLKLVALLTITSFANAKLGKNSKERGNKNERKKEREKKEKLGERGDFLKDMKAVDVGTFHTAAFEKFGELYSDKELESDFELMQDVSEVMASFCPREDALCDAFVYQTTLEEFYVGNNGGHQLENTEGFNEDIWEALEITKVMIESLNEDNLDAVVDDFTVILDDLEKMKKVDKREQALAIASVSVAKESTKLWYDAFTNEENSLHPLVASKINSRRRRLDDIFTFIIEGKYWDGIFGPNGLLVNVIKADYFGTVKGAQALSAAVPENPLLIWPWNWPTNIVYVAAFHAVPASVQFIFGSNSTATIPM